MGTHKIRLIEAVLTRAHNLWFKQKKKKIIAFFHLKIIVYTAVRYCSIAHGCVFVICEVVHSMLRFFFLVML